MTLAPAPTPKPATPREAPGQAMPPPGSVGFVETRTMVLPGLMTLESGRTLRDIVVAYEVYGTISAARDNVILVCHALSGDAHAAGYHQGGGAKPGWWDTMIGPGKAFDTDHYAVLCSNVLGGCRGTTGPLSLDPETDAPYAATFPVVTIGDMVQVQAALLDRLGIYRLAAVAGGSMGGMQALHWSTAYPARVESVVVLASCARLTAQALAFNAVGRQAIMSDPRWRGGRYPTDDPPTGGLAAARMIGHLTYLSAEGLEHRFGRRHQYGDGDGFTLDTDFQVESYLEHQGASFVNRFDANCYLYMTRALDYFDLGAGSGSLSAALARATASFFLASLSTDWLYPPAQTEELAAALAEAGASAEVVALDSLHGHDGFLLEHEALGPRIRAFLGREDAAQARS